MGNAPNGWPAETGDKKRDQSLLRDQDAMTVFLLFVMIVNTVVGFWVAGKLGYGATISETLGAIRGRLPSRSKGPEDPNEQSSAAA